MHQMAINFILTARLLTPTSGHAYLTSRLPNWVRVLCYGGLSAGARILPGTCQTLVAIASGVFVSIGYYLSEIM